MARSLSSRYSVFKIPSNRGYLLKDVYVGIRKDVSCLRMGVIKHIDVCATHSTAAVLCDVLMAVDQKMRTIRNHTWVNCNRPARGRTCAGRGTCTIALGASGARAVAGQFEASERRRLPAIDRHRLSRRLCCLLLLLRLLYRLCGIGFLHGGEVWVGAGIEEKYIPQALRCIDAGACTLVCIRTHGHRHRKNHQYDEHRHLSDHTSLLL